jgi:hypothetical protein
MGLFLKDDGWRIPDELWEKMEPLLPPRPKHPLGCHNPRVSPPASLGTTFTGITGYQGTTPRDDFARTYPSSAEALAASCEG